MLTDNESRLVEGAVFTSAPRENERAVYARFARMAERGVLTSAKTPESQARIDAAVQIGNAILEETRRKYLWTRPNEG